MSATDWPYKPNMVQIETVQGCNRRCKFCGVPPEWQVSQQGNIGQAIIIARERGEVHFSDIMESISKYFSFPWCGAAGYNTGSNKARALNYDTTMAQFLRDNWNNPSKGTSPAREYGGILVPAGRDENGDVVYKYALKGEGDNGEMEQK